MVYDLNTVQIFWLLQPYYSHLSCMYHHEVQEMLPNKASEDLEIKASLLIKPSLLSEHLSINIPGKGLVAYCRNASIETKKDF